MQPVFCTDTFIFYTALPILKLILFVNINHMTVMWRGDYTLQLHWTEGNLFINFLNLYPVIWELSFVLQALIRKIMWKFSFPTDWISERTNKTQMLHRVVFTFSNKFILWNCWIKLIPVATVILIKRHSPEIHVYDENGNVLRMVIETITNICLDNSDVRLSCIVDWTYLWANAH